MTVRIAAVVDPGRPGDEQSLARARELSRQGAPDLEWWPVTAAVIGRTGLDGVDGLWLTGWDEGPAAERVGGEAWRLAGLGVPVVVSPAEPPAGFVAQARARAAYRTAWEQERLRAAAEEAAEREPRTYVSQMRGPRMRWWRPLVALAVAAAVMVAGTVVSFLPLLLGDAGSAEAAEAAVDPTDPLAAVSMNVLLACLIPATLLGVWVGFRRSPWRVLSVSGRMRWGWLARCFLVVLPLWAAYLAVTWFVFEQEVLPRPEHWVALLVITLVTTPFQAAGEEVAFRGGLVQGVGAWIRSPVAALVVTTVLSTAGFVAAHGSADPWIVVELGSFAVAGCWLAWRTGGLEATIALHIVNNLLVMATGILLGGLEESYVDGTSQGSPVSAGMNVVATAVVTAVLLRLARRRGVAPAGWTTPARG